MAVQSKALVAPGKIYLRETTGRYTRLRWLMVWLTQSLYFGLPWLRSDDQPVLLLDLSKQNLHFFGWIFRALAPFDLVMLLILAALIAILPSVIVARVWCGFACPHSVYTDIFMWIERQLEGGRSARMRLDRSPMSRQKIWRKMLKHGAWILLSLWIGMTFAAYFVPMNVLLHEARTFTLGTWTLIVILAYGLLAYANAGWWRERFCSQACPFPMLQSAVLGREALRASYNAIRGEPRALRNRKSLELDRPRGDCVDCTLCVQVCPAGRDIRLGWDRDCMGCAACIDVCNQVMDKIGAPRGLIRYASADGISQGLSTSEMGLSLLRPRVLLYVSALAALIVAAGLNLMGHLS